jgi:hypothetical protein
VLVFVGDIEEKQLWFFGVVLCKEIQSLRRNHHMLITSVLFCNLVLLEFGGGDVRRKFCFEDFLV